MRHESPVDQQSNTRSRSGSANSQAPTTKQKVLRRTPPQSSVVGPYTFKPNVRLGELNHKKLDDVCTIGSKACTLPRIWTKQELCQAISDFILDPHNHLIINTWATAKKEFTLKVLGLSKVAALKSDLGVSYVGEVFQQLLTQKDQLACHACLGQGNFFKVVSDEVFHYLTGIKPLYANDYSKEKKSEIFTRDLPDLLKFYLGKLSPQFDYASIFSVGFGSFSAHAFRSCEELKMPDAVRLLFIAHHCIKKIPKVPSSYARELIKVFGACLLTTDYYLVKQDDSYGQLMNHVIAAIKANSAQLFTENGVFTSTFVSDLFDHEVFQVIKALFSQAKDGCLQLQAQLAELLKSRIKDISDISLRFAMKNIHYCANKEVLDLLFNPNFNQAITILSKLEKCDSNLLTCLKSVCRFISKADDDQMTEVCGLFGNDPINTVNLPCITYSTVFNLLQCNFRYYFDLLGTKDSGKISQGLCAVQPVSTQDTTLSRDSLEKMQAYFTQELGSITMQAEVFDRLTTTDAYERAVDMQTLSNEKYRADDYHCLIVEDLLERQKNILVPFSKSRAFITLPTGQGKTYLMLLLIRVLHSRNKYEKIFVLTLNKDLQRQFSTAALSTCNFMISILNLQCISLDDRNRLNEVNKNDLVIVDEADLVLRQGYYVNEEGMFDSVLALLNCPHLFFTTADDREQVVLMARRLLEDSYIERYNYKAQRTILTDKLSLDIVIKPHVELETSFYDCCEHIVECVNKTGKRKPAIVYIQDELFDCARERLKEEVESDVGIFELKPSLTINERESIYDTIGEIGVGILLIPIGMFTRGMDFKFAATSNVFVCGTVSTNTDLVQMVGRSARNREPSFGYYYCVSSTTSAQKIEENLVKNGCNEILDVTPIIYRIWFWQTRARLVNKKDYPLVPGNIDLSRAGMADFINEIFSKISTQNGVDHRKWDEFSAQVVPFASFMNAVQPQDELQHDIKAIYTYSKEQNKRKYSQRQSRPDQSPIGKSNNKRKRQEMEKPVKLPKKMKPISEVLAENEQSLDDGDLSQKQELGQKSVKRLKGEEDGKPTGVIDLSAFHASNESKGNK